jgi:hypothetical protein
VALVAVPVLLKKPFQAPAPAPATAQSPADQSLKEQAKVVLADQEAGNGSRLNLFDPTDPFRPPKSAQKKKEDTGASATTSGGSPGAGTSISSGGGDTSGGGGSLPLESGGGGGGGFTPTGSTPKVKVTKYTYVIDVTYKHNGHTRKEKGMTALEMLPNSASPLLVFLGVDSKATNAVFIVDSNLHPAPEGEGKCKPSDDNCNFLYLGVGNQETFTTSDGQTYTLQIDGIRKVKVKSKSAKASSKKHKKASSSQARDHIDSTGSQSAKPKPARRFVPPLLLNLVTVSNSGDRN